jgi:hypothetical protein
MACIEEFEYIAPYHTQIANPELPTAADDPVLLHMRYLYCRDRTGTAADTLDTDTSRTGKQIQHINPLKVHPVIEQIEQALLGKVRCGPCGYIFRGRQPPPPVYTTNNPHYSQLPALLFGA